MTNALLSTVLFIAMSYSPISKALGQDGWPDAGGGYVILPSGAIVHQSCIHGIPNNSAVDYNDNVWDINNNLIASYTGECAYPRKDLPRNPPSGENDNWVDYAVASVGGVNFYDEIYANWTVPQAPMNNMNAQTVYLFDSLQSRDGYLILQPVLQYMGGGFNAGKYQMCSYVYNGKTAYMLDNDPSNGLQANCVTVASGDVIYGQILLQTFDEYEIQWSDVTQNITRQVRFLPNAVIGPQGQQYTEGSVGVANPAVMEAYILACGDLPGTSPVTFSGIGVFSSTTTLWNGGNCTWNIPYCYTPADAYVGSLSPNPPVNCPWSNSVNTKNGQVSLFDH